MSKWLQMRVPAECLLIGDVMLVDGRELHDDLAGLVCEIPVDHVSVDGFSTRVIVMPRTPKYEHRWRVGEVVTVVREVP